MEDSSSDVEFIEEIPLKVCLSKPLNEKKKKHVSTRNCQGSFNIKLSLPSVIKADVDTSGKSLTNKSDLIKKKRARLSLSNTLGRKMEDSSDSAINNRGYFDMQLSPPASIKQINLGDLESPTNHSFKLSKSLSQSPNKFIPRIASNGSPSRKTKNNSPSKKLIKNSPVRYLKNKATNRNRSSVASSRSPFKKLQFDSLEVNEASQPISGYNHSTLDHINASNFCSILTTTMLYLNDTSIFNEQELKTVNDFIEMPWQNKELYVRMYGRKAGWHRVCNIHYSNISDNLSLVFRGLERAGFVTYDYSNEKLDVMLCLLQVPELKSLCKDLKLKLCAKSKKPDLMKALLDFCSSQQTLNFGSTNSKKTPSELNNSSKVLKNKLLNVLNDCISLSKEPLQIFGRMVLLFSLSRSSSTEEREDVSQYLLLMHFVNIGKMVFPSCQVIRHCIFYSRDHFLSFEEARELESSIVEIIEQKEWKSVANIACQALERLMQVLKDDKTSIHDQGLPLFLRKFTAGSTFSYLLTVAAEAMKKETSLVTNAIDILQTLLSQKLYLTEYRGRWYEQLALLYQHKLNDNTRASEVVVAALSDDLVTEVWRYTLFDRGATLLGRKTNQPNPDAKEKLALIIDKEERLLDPSSIKIVSKSLDNKPGFKKVYVQVDLEKGETTYSSVEEFALSHYKLLGFVRGMHCEGAIIVSLFGLFFWDIIYELPIPGAFQSVYQSEPLDLRSPEFYKNRREAIDQRLTEMYHWNIDKIKAVVDQAFTEHKDKISLVNWDTLKAESRVLDIVMCLSISVVTKICARLVKNFRIANSGFPDLIVWDPDSGKCKFVEVKGKGDQLSVKQRVWLDYLKKIGADAEVCHVHHG